MSWGGFTNLAEEQWDVEIIFGEGCTSLCQSSSTKSDDIPDRQVGDPDFILVKVSDGKLDVGDNFV